ncbi:MAG: hypothetical protein ACI4D0_09040 [Lachnospira sp.]
MKDKRRKILACIASFVIFVVSVPVLERESSVVYGDEGVSEIECSSVQELKDCLANCSADTNMTISLTASINSSETFQVNSGNIVLNLNGFSMTGTGTVLQVSGGALTITGNGSIQGAGYAVHVRSGQITVNDGRIVGSPASDGAVALMVNTGAKAYITGGEIIENLSASDFGFACYAAPGSEINISGGTFTLNGTAGKSLWIDSGVTASITGGTYNNYIARKMESAPADSEIYKVFYGQPGNRDIIKENYILTDNTFTYEQNYVRTEQSVSVVKGSIITLNTNRSAVETYQDDETALREAADNGGIVFVGAEGKLYSDDSIIPSIDAERVTDGNTYEWGGWKDGTGNVWDSATAYAQKNSGADVVLTGVWNLVTSSGTNMINGTGKYYLGSGREYTLESGVWMVTGDSTLYNGGIHFTVEKDGEYEFQKQ